MDAKFEKEKHTLVVFWNYYWKKNEWEVLVDEKLTTKNKFKHSQGFFLCSESFCIHGVNGWSVRWWYTFNEICQVWFNCFSPVYAESEIPTNFFDQKRKKNHHKQNHSLFSMTIKKKKNKLAAFNFSIQNVSFIQNVDFHWWKIFDFSQNFWHGSESQGDCNQY